MYKNCRVIKELIKNNKKISIIQNSDGKNLFMKLIVNTEKEEMIGLENEIKCLNILSSTGVVPKIIDYNLNVETPYIITEYINYKRLDRYIFSSLNEKLKVMINIIDAINLIHEKKIIHCDLKPQQIFIDNNFNVKIIDFGISSIDGVEVLTNHGSKDYCSPEKINRQKITIYSDMFSLGIIFYELITSELPFERDLYNIRKEIDYSKIKRIENEELNRIFLKTIDENYNFRYKNLEQFKQDIKEILNKKEG